jgi:hypothetical protein
MLFPRSSPWLILVVGRIERACGFWFIHFIHEKTICDYWRDYRCRVGCWLHGLPLHQETGTSDIGVCFGFCGWQRNNFWFDRGFGRSRLELGSRPIHSQEVSRDMTTPNSLQATSSRADARLLVPEFSR